MVIMVPLLPLKLMVRSWLGVTQTLGVQMHLLMAAIPKFMQITMPLLPLKLMAKAYEVE
jgi:hypothetical protein